MNTEELVDALDAMEYTEQHNPSFDLKAHRKIREGLLNYERDRRRRALLAKWSVIVTFLVWLTLWLLV